GPGLGLVTDACCPCQQVLLICRLPGWLMRRAVARVRGHEYAESVLAGMNAHLPAVVEDAHQAVVPADPYLLLKEMVRHRVVTALDFDEAVHVHGPGAHLEHLEASARQWPQGRLLDLQEVRQHLAPGGPVDAELGDRAVPAPKELVVLLQALEATALERALDVGAGALLDALLLGMAGLGGQGREPPVLGEDRVDLVEIRVVQTGAGDAALGVVEAHHFG